MSDIFLSYSTENEKQAKKICELLESNGFTCWYAPQSIRGTQDFTAEIPKAIRESKAFLLLLSNSAQESRWVERELGTADELKMPIYTLALEECRLNDSFGFMLKFSQRYDHSEGLEGQTQRLLRELKEDLQREAPPEKQAPAPKKKPWWLLAAGAAVVAVAVALVLILTSGGMKDGDYVLWNPDYGMAMTGNKVSVHYLAGEAVAYNGEKLTGYSGKCVWTLDFTSKNTFTMSRNGQTLGMEPGYNGIGFGGEYTADRWVLEPAGNGRYYVRNEETDYYLEWFEDKDNWATYNKVNGGNRDLFRIRLDQAK